MGWDDAGGADGHCCSFGVHALPDIRLDNRHGWSRQDPNPRSGPSECLDYIDK